jgi:hypothetical protein
MNAHDPRTDPAPGDVLHYRESASGTTRTIRVEATTDASVEYWTDSEPGVRKHMMLEAWRTQAATWKTAG